MKTNFDIPLKLNKRDRFKAKYHSNRYRRSVWGYLDSKNEDFKCMNCRTIVSAFSGLSMVNHRNHCPYCLHSRHVDLYEAGDRLSACKADMKPVGLVLKKTTKKYHQQGELMLLHQCSECGAYSINRIAADDDAGSLMEVYKESLEMQIQTRAWLEEMDIQILGARDHKIVRAQLLGQ